MMYLLLKHTNQERSQHSIMVQKYSSEIKEVWIQISAPAFITSEIWGSYLTAIKCSFSTTYLTKLLQELIKAYV